MKIYLFNGPPRSGKDTAGAMLAQMLGEDTVLAKFAMPLKMATHAVMSIFGNRSGVVGTDYYEELKDDVCDDFFGVTPRQAYIAMSEMFAKPLWGKAFFGEVLALHLKELEKQGKTSAVITDCGFQEEAEYLVEAFGAENVALLQVYRPGYTYDNDSRSYLSGIAGVDSATIMNDGNLSALRREVIEVMEDLQLFQEEAV